MDFSRPERKHSFHYEDPLCISKLGNTLYSFLGSFNPDLSRTIIYLCIGTDRATGDCLGPLVGTRLQSLLPRADVFGTLENPIHATNLQDTLTYIGTRFSSPLIMAVDASLGSSDRIGFINVNEGSLRPGTALKKDLPEVGDYHISGVVNVGGFLEHMVLQNTRLYTVYRMAEIIARCIYLAHSKIDVDKRDLIGKLSFRDSDPEKSIQYHG